MKKLNCVLFGACLVIISIVNIAVAGESNKKRSRKAQEAVKIKVTPWGPTQADVQAATLRVEKSRALQTVLRNTKYRLISFDYVESGNEKSKTAQPPTSFRVIQRRGKRECFNSESGIKDVELDWRMSRMQRTTRTRFGLRFLPRLRLFKM